MSLIKIIEILAILVGAFSGFIEARAKKMSEAKKAMEDAEAQAQHDGGIEPVKEESEDKKE